MPDAHAPGKNIPAEPSDQIDRLFIPVHALPVVFKARDGQLCHGMIDQLFVEGGGQGDIVAAGQRHLGDLLHVSEARGEHLGAYAMQAENLADAAHALQPVPDVRQLVDIGRNEVRPRPGADQRLLGREDRGHRDADPLVFQQPAGL